MLKVVFELKNLVPFIRHQHKAPISIFKKLSVANLLFTLQVALPAYAGSLYLAQFMPEERVGLIFMGGALLTLLIFPLLSNALTRWGNYRLTIYATTFLIFALLGVALAQSTTSAVLWFIISYALTYVIVFTLDIFMEQYTEDERITGATRAFFLSAGIVAFIIAPLIAGLILTDYEYWRVFLVSALVLIPFTYLIGTTTNGFVDATYTQVRITRTLATIARSPNIRLIMLLHLVLRVTFSWNAIVFPLYLINQLGMSWSEFGTIMAIAFSAYLFVFYPAGRIADSILGEKELLISGFLIMGFALMLVPLLPGAVVALWALVLFVYRIGAALVEGMTESYFFKQVDGGNQNVIAVFRMMGPLGYIIGPGIASLLLATISFTATFMVFGLIMAIAAMATLPLVDTK